MHSASAFRVYWSAPPRLRWAPECLLLAALLVQVVSAWGLELSFDETYYLMWAHHPAWSYLDHPPGIGWLLISVAGLGSHELLSRLPGLLCGLVQVLCLTSLMRRAFGKATARLTAATLACSVPLWWSSVILSPDAPLLAFWALTLLAYERAQQLNRPRDWVRVGAALGGALLSKYMALLLVLGLLLHLAFYRRDLLRQRGTWWAALVALVVFCPVLAWNAAHGGASFLFQMDLGARHLDGVHGLQTFQDFVGGQVLLLGPLLAWGMWGSLRTAWRHKSDPTVGLLLITGLLPLGVFAVSALGQAVEVNWALCAWLSLVPLVAWARPRVALGSAASFLAFAAGVMLYLQHPLADARHDVTSRFFGWRDLAEDVDRCARDAGLGTWYVLGDSRRETTQVHYYLDAQHEARPTGNRARFFFVPAESLLGQDAVMLMDLEDATPAEVERLARQEDLEVLQACGASARRHVNGQAVDHFALFAMTPRVHGRPLASMRTTSAEKTK